MKNIKTEYDLIRAFKRIENELITSMVNNLYNHIDEEKKVGISYEQWQTKQLKALQQYRYSNNKEFKKKFGQLNSIEKNLMNNMYNDTKTKSEKNILDGLLKTKKSVEINEKWKKEVSIINKRKLNKLIEATTSDLSKAEYSTLRMADDQYRKIIFDSQVYLNTGAGSLKSAVDMATRDFLSQGLNSIEYKNGRRVDIGTYSEMCLRTSNKRAYMQGESAAREEYGLHLVIINRKGTACNKCIDWLGKVLIDNVYGSGKPDGKHQLLSTAMEAGLFHPNCKDVMTTYIEGVTEVKPITNEEKKRATELYTIQQRQNYCNRQVKKYTGLKNIDSKKYQDKYTYWKNRSSENSSLYKYKVLSYNNGYGGNIERYIKSNKTQLTNIKDETSINKW